LTQNFIDSDTNVGRHRLTCKGANGHNNDLELPQLQSRVNRQW